MKEKKIFKTILLTGGSGTLGKAIIKSELFSNIIAPSKNQLNLIKKSSIKRFLNKYDIDAIINCAAKARMTECENNPADAVETNITGTANLIAEVLRSKKKIRFIHISTDGVYHSTSGNYSEHDATIPYNTYGWTKLGSECAVNALSNFCIIRTRFFDPERIPHKNSAIDIYTSSIPIKSLIEAIAELLVSDFIGTVNVGSKRESDYEKYVKFKPSISKCFRKDILKKLNYEIAHDASLNIKKWLGIKKRHNAKF